MATYYHGNSEIQADALQTLVLTNPGYVGFSDPQSAAAHFAFHNPSAGAANSYSHQPPHFVGHPQDISLHHGFPPRPHYVSWNPMEVGAAPGGEREGPRPQQGLSLSLSPQQPARYGAYCGEPQEGVSQALAPSGLPTQVGESLRMPCGSSVAASRITNAVSGMQSVLLSSRFLKAAQLLLEEFVNVGNGMKNESAGKRPHGKMVGESSASAADGDGDKRCPEQSTAGRQEVLMKKAKLVSMLDEVEQRYRQYQQQMQMVIAGFEQMAGIGSAKTYTSLALKTISKQFRSLNDAIDGQIAAANRSLGEDVSTTGGKGEGSRLRFVDHQLRQQRALQQLGMIQPNNAWRPQRGLPERAVSVLRAWLFEHFLHPYPKDSDKHMLAKQTGLTRNQVSNWFINARVRLWKPMVEEMYTEEIKEHEQNQSDKTTTSDGGFAEKCPIPDNRDGNSTAASVSLAGVTAVTVIASQGSPKRPRTTESRLFASDSPDADIKPEGGNPNDVVWMKFGVDGQSPRQGTDEYSANFIGGFGSYPIGEIGRFDGQHFSASFTGSGNANVNGNVSLTLGLPHCENLSLSGSDRRNYLPNHGIQMVGPAEYSGLSTAAAATVSGFEDLNIQSQKRFAAQLLPDFVA